MSHTNLEARTDQAVRSVQQQVGGTHADEIETSMMLYIDPSVVDMTTRGERLLAGAAGDVSADAEPRARTGPTHAPASGETPRSPRARRVASSSKRWWRAF